MISSIMDTSHEIYSRRRDNASEKDFRPHGDKGNTVKLFNFAND